MKFTSIFSTIFVASLLFTAGRVHAQSLPSGACGIVYTYDAAGNRTGYSYLCNNGSVASANNKNELAVAKPAVDTPKVIQVNALYPNPTTGQFVVKLVTPLQNATITIVDMGGRAVFKTVANGSTLNLSLYGQPSGMYILHISQGQQAISMKVVKR